MLIVDCHAHIYALDTVRYPATPGARPPAPGTGSVEQLRSQAQAAGVQLVRLVQTVSYHGYDNRYLVDAADANAAWATGVVTLDPDDSISAQTLRNLAQRPGVSALRSIPSRSRRTFADESVRQLWRIAIDAGLTIDMFLMDAGLVDSAKALLDEFADVAVGFCHCMDLKPGPHLTEDLRAVLSLARYPNVHPKVDFIGTGTQMPYPCETELLAVAKTIIDEYGAERCLWGSCYPNEVWTPQISYAEHVRLFTDALDLTPTQRRQVLGENARRLWFPHLPAD